MVAVVNVIGIIKITNVDLLKVLDILEHVVNQNHRQQNATQFLTVKLVPLPVVVDIDSKARVGCKNAPLALGVDNEPDNKVETCIDGFAPKSLLGSDIDFSFLSGSCYAVYKSVDCYNICCSRIRLYN